MGLTRQNTTRERITVARVGTSRCPGAFTCAGCGCGVDYGESGWLDELGHTYCSAACCKRNVEVEIISVGRNDARRELERLAVSEWMEKPGVTHAVRNSDTRPGFFGKFAGIPLS